MSKIILASKSPRRIEILKSLGLKFEVAPSKIKEVYPPDLSIEKIPEFLAERKAEDVFGSLEDKKNVIVIAADTLVFKDGRIFGKPKDKREAFEMIKAFSGTFHFVITGLCVLASDKKLVRSVKTKVFFKRLSNEDIDEFLKREKFLDKAGAYAIQEWGKVLVERIEGDFYNIVGLPVVPLLEMLKGVGVRVV